MNKTTMRRMTKYEAYRLPLDQLVYCMEFWRGVCDTMAAKQMRKWAAEKRALRPECSVLHPAAQRVAPRLVATNLPHSRNKIIRHKSSDYRVIAIKIIGFGT